MSKAKFTKGEWKLKPTDFHMEFELTTDERVEDSKVSIVTIDTCYSGYIGDEQKANANLIAAAPLMYEMLKRLSEKQWDASEEEEIENLLAKARGEK